MIFPTREDPVQLCPRIFQTTNLHLLYKVHTPNRPRLSLKRQLHSSHCCHCTHSDPNTYSPFQVPVLVVHVSFSIDLTNNCTYNCIHVAAVQLYGLKDIVRVSSRPRGNAPRIFTCVPLSFLSAERKRASIFPKRSMEFPLGGHEMCLGGHLTAPWSFLSDERNSAFEVKINS
jgi:hypothetical protein